MPAATLDAYKRQVAQRIVSGSAYVYDEPVQPLLKSIVVLDISIDAQGRLQRVAVRRSNGFKELEQRAIDSVRRAAPFAVPPHQRGVSYLETFLFRHDGRFRVRSLVES
jgi:TonB family protein